MVQRIIKQSFRRPLPLWRLGWQRTNQYFLNLLPFSDSKPLQYCTPAQHNYLMLDCIAAEITHESAVQGGTHAKQARAWKRWCEYNKRIRNNDLFLEFFFWHQRIKIIGAFALALCKGQFSGPAYDQLVESTVSGTISYLCATFRENGFPNPSLDKDARTGFLLQQLCWGFKNADPAEQHQKAIPMCVIAEIGKKTLSELSIAIFQLACLAIFFACWSCEYLKVPAAQQQRTQILR